MKLKFTKTTTSICCTNIFAIINKLFKYFYPEKHAETKQETKNNIYYIIINPISSSIYINYNKIMYMNNYYLYFII